MPYVAGGKRRNSIFLSVLPFEQSLHRWIMKNPCFSPGYYILYNLYDFIIHVYVYIYCVYVCFVNLYFHNLIYILSSSVCIYCHYTSLGPSDLDFLPFLQYAFDYHIIHFIFLDPDFFQVNIIPCTEVG